MKKIGYNEMNFLPNSRFDPQGRLFTYGNNVYRLMLKYNLDYYKKLLSVISNNEILSTYIIETKISDLSTDQNNVILQHEFLNLVSYPGNWSSEMYKDAFLAHCLINLELIKEGYTLQDAHLWNITFKNCNPIFLDFGSIIQDNGRNEGLSNEYLVCVFYPLYLIRKGAVDKSKRYLTHSEPTLELRDLIGYFSIKDFFALVNLWRLKRNSDIRKIIEYYINYINSMTIQRSNSQWMSYHKDEILRDKTGDSHSKQKNIFKILKDKKPTSLLDVGCSTGYYSFMAAKLNIETISLDSDDYCINEVFLYAKEHNLQITPLIEDIFALQTRKEEYQSDMVFALAILHHLVFTQKYTFESICSVLSYYSKKWLIIEFIDENDTFVAENKKENFAFYTFDGLVNELKKYYNELDLFESTSKNRTLILCKKTQKKVIV